jgi:hypothetical protein
MGLGCEEVSRLAMKTFIGIFGLKTLMEAHPEFDWLRVELELEKIRVVISRNGELFTGECTDKEAKINSHSSSIWELYREKMTRITATRRAIEKAFPEFQA